MEWTVHRTDSKIACSFLFKQIVLGDDSEIIAINNASRLSQRSEVVFHKPIGVWKLK